MEHELCVAYEEVKEINSYCYQTFSYVFPYHIDGNIFSSWKLFIHQMYVRFRLIVNKCSLQSRDDREESYERCRSIDWILNNGNEKSDEILSQFPFPLGVNTKQKKVELDKNVFPCVLPEAQQGASKL